MQVFSDMARTTLVSESGGSITVTDGARFPAANRDTAADSDAVTWFKVVLQRGTDYEVCHVRTHGAGSASFTNVLRGQDGTSQQSWAAGDTQVTLAPLAADMAAAMAGGGFVTGDVVFSLNASAHTLPDWLACNGAFVANASMPASLEPFAALACAPSFSYDRDPESPGAAPTTILDINDNWALAQFSASPYLRFYKKEASGTYEYSSVPYAAATPSSALRCAAVDAAGYALTFKTAAGSAEIFKLVGSSISKSAASSDFTGRTIVGCVSGADGRFYTLQTDGVYLYSWETGGGTETGREEGGCGASPAGLCISPNKRFMASWHSATPYVFLWEYNGSNYVLLGSPPLGASSFTRLEISDTGVFVGKPASGSVFYVGHVTSTGAVGAMLSTTVNAATAWGLMPDGRHLIDWLSNVASYRPIVNDSIGAASSLTPYASGTYGTLYQRPGITSAGQLLWASSVAAYGYALCAKATPDGYMAPNIRNGFLKA